MLHRFPATIQTCVCAWCELCIISKFQVVWHSFAVRLRPRNAEELQADVDFADCVELQPEVCFEDQDFNLGLSEAKLQIFVDVTMMKEMVAFDFL